MLFDEPVARLGATTITFGETVLAAGGVLALLLIVLVVALVRASRARALAAGEAAERAREAETRMAEIMKAQAEMQGRMGAMAEVFGARQADLNKAIGDRLDGMTSRLGHSISEQTKSTHENLAKLQERLAVIDTAQTNIQSLANQVVELQSILSNKQTRGAFGQNRMEAIIADGLPIGAFDFQFTLSNGNRPDCVVYMPNDAPPLVIDAKFPLESWHAIRDAGSEADAKPAVQRFRRDMDVHIKAIAERYFIPGETQDTAFMFVPSESIFAEIHENHEAVVHKAHRARVVIVSPSLLMLSIQVVQALLKDARMREQAHLIQAEVMHLMKDLSLLGERVGKLKTHFQQAGRDIEQIEISTGKLARRGAKIEGLEFDGQAGGDRMADGPRDQGEKPAVGAVEETKPRLFSVKGGS
ncbi:MAG: DNA recombination protein RmuC [Rhizobiaceae bacterium]